MTVADQRGEEEFNITQQAQARKKGDHRTIRKRLQEAGVLRVSEEQGLGNNLHALRQLTNVIAEIEQDVKLKLNTEYCKSYMSWFSGRHYWGLDALDGDQYNYEYNIWGDGEGIDVYVADTGINPNHEDFSGRVTGLDALDGDQYNYEYNIWGDGEGIDVYVADTGINPNHEDFSGRVTVGWPTSTSVDDDGHGTHVASIIGGTNSGVAKSANIISLKICSNYGCPLSGILNACLWAKQRVQSSGRLSVINFSIGAPFIRSLNDAVDDLLAAGIPAIVSAGNANDNACDYSPASTANALTVGAFNEGFEKASFSNHGSCVDLYAPGEGIEAADFSGNDKYTIMSGTSMAAPFVTGAVAAWLQVLRDDGTISSPSAQVVNYANIHIIQYALPGKLTGVSEANLALSTPCLVI
ncbi:alkaline proteinase-like [Lingula anatina]|uniref:Alkaline proteinase-like n=1 Tax=Lingula anatina TaxID=7574 RepID=A0A1S3HUD8_LINAN|nr:alkaline proteinase-like [Lingula anatina]|eukprot:XP_013389657.1 alkaline proteinase-like [Lingula anatina]